MDTSTWSRAPVWISGAKTAARCCTLWKNSSRGRWLMMILPSPGRMRTRATDVLRRPVPSVSGVVALGIGYFLLDAKFFWLGLLGLVRVLLAGVDLQLVEHLEGQFVLRQHPAHGLTEDLFGPALEARGGRLG